MDSVGKHEVRGEGRHAGGRPRGAKDKRPRTKVYRPRAPGDQIAIEVERDEESAGSEYLSFRDKRGNMATLRFADASEKNRVIDAAVRSHSSRRALDEGEQERVVGDMIVTSVRDRMRHRALLEAVRYCCGVDGAKQIEDEAKKRLEAYGGH